MIRIRQTGRLNGGTQEATHLFTESISTWMASDCHIFNAVTYVLHPTFKEPTRQVFRTASNPRCKLELWTWGLFRVQAIVADKDGNMSTLTHNLQYDKEFRGVTFAA